MVLGPGPWFSVLDLGSLSWVLVLGPGSWFSVLSLGSLVLVLGEKRDKRGRDKRTHQQKTVLALLLLMERDSERGSGEEDRERHTESERGRERDRQGREKENQLTQDRTNKIIFIDGRSLSSFDETQSSRRVSSGVALTALRPVVLRPDGNLN